MGHYKSNVRDIEFNLFEMFDTDGVLKTGAFGDLDSDTVRMMLEGPPSWPRGPVAAAFESSDRTPPSFDADTHDVKPAGRLQGVGQRLDRSRLGRRSA